MEFHTREMIREGVAQGIGMSLMFEKECPPDSRIRVLPRDTSSPLIEVKGYLALRTERKRMPLIRQSLRSRERWQARDNAPLRSLSTRFFAPKCDDYYAASHRLAAAREVAGLRWQPSLQGAIDAP